MIRPSNPDFLTKIQHDRIEVGGVKLGFQRTCRVPEGKINSLPAGLGYFPVFKVSDFKSDVPKNWHEEAYFFPMYQSEAMWINFDGANREPKAIVIASGNINAISGKPFDVSKDNGSKKKSKLDFGLKKEQNYVVVPPQPWIDGWKSKDGKVYQFVAAELGSGETVEGQITGEETIGGLQLITYDPKPGLKLIPESRPNEYMSGGSPMIFLSSMSMGATRGISKGIQSMGLGKGGSIEQKIYDDPHGLEVWNENPTEISRIYIVSSLDFKQITGRDAPSTPLTYQKYQELNMPWFDLYDEKLTDTPGSKVFDKLKPVSGGYPAGKPIKKADSSILK